MQNQCSYNTNPSNHISQAIFFCIKTHFIGYLNETEMATEKLKSFASAKYKKLKRNESVKFHRDLTSNY